LRRAHSGIDGFDPQAGSRPGYSQSASVAGASLKQLAVENFLQSRDSRSAVLDSNTGFTFFNIQGTSTTTIPRRNACHHQWQPGRFQKSLPRRSPSSDAGAVVGTISIGEVMQADRYHAVPMASSNQ